MFIHRSTVFWKQTTKQLIKIFYDNFLFKYRYRCEHKRAKGIFTKINNYYYYNYSYFVFILYLLTFCIFYYFKKLCLDSQNITTII